MKEIPWTTLLLTMAVRANNIWLRVTVLCSLAVVLCFSTIVTESSILPGKSKSKPVEDRVRRDNQRVNIGSSAAAVEAEPKFYRTKLNENAQRKLLRHAPMEFSKDAGQKKVIMALPMPDGQLARFSVEQSPIMEPRLAAMFPEIKTYRGQGLDDPTATARFDITPAGFHAIVLSTNGTVIIEPAKGGRAGQYVSYDQRGSAKDGAAFQCLTSNEGYSSGQPFLRSSSTVMAPTTGATLRTYRLALAATAEYSQTYGGGTVAGAFAAMTTTINAVNAIYERDLSIRLTLINNETSIIFTNAGTDPYTSDNVNSMLTQNQTALDQRIGSSNYDVGFVLDGREYAFQPGFFLFQGAGQFQSVCVNGQKGKGVTILRSIEPSTISAIWDVAHELGHQFGALHTFNGTTEDCGNSRFPQTAYEVGSGSTIMGYRGGTAPNGQYLPLCTFEDLHSVDTYFHATSIEQIVNYVTVGAGRTCPVQTDTGNNPPAVEAGPDFIIPAQTPFTLTATASDPEADALTYCWEEYDLGTAGPPHTDDGSRPIFRSFAPVTSPSRTFPQLSDVLSGTSTFGESLPTTTRGLNFRVTVRDNHAGVGGVNMDSMRVTVRSDAGPFVVTGLGASTTWTAGSTQTVTWNVANTANAPVSCANVRILLSVDGGNSFPHVLSSSTPNNGSATITVPNTPTAAARVKVEAVGNIFFNISLPSFTITPNNSAPPVIFAEEITNKLAALESVWFVRDPFTLFNDHNLSFDQRTRIVLFATGLELMPGENNSVVTAQAEYPGHGSFPLDVESVAKIPNASSITQVNLRLPTELANAGDVLVSVSLRGAPSNKLMIKIQ